MNGPLFFLTAAIVIVNGFIFYLQSQKASNYERVFFDTTLMADQKHLGKY